LQIRSSRNVRGDLRKGVQVVGMSFEQRISYTITVQNPEFVIPNVKIPNIKILNFKILKVKILKPISRI